VSGPVKISAESSVLDRVDALRRVAARLIAGELGADGVWLGVALDRYLQGASDGLTLGAALDVEPGAWWQAEQRARRDDALREYAQRFLQGGSGWARATALSEAVLRYASTAWLQDRRTGLSAGMAGLPREVLHRAFAACDGDMPGSAKQFERILTDHNFGHGPPVAMSKTSVHKKQATSGRGKRS
jgi:hypothetical protein